MGGIVLGKILGNTFSHLHKIFNQQKPKENLKEKKPATVFGIKLQTFSWDYQSLLLFYVFFCTLLYVHSSIAIILMGKRELVALLNLSSWCLVMVEWLFLAVPLGCLRFVIVVFPDHTDLLFCAKES